MAEVYPGQSPGTMEGADAAQEPMNPEGPSRFLKDVEAVIRSGFIRKVYFILTVQLLLTAAIAWPIIEGGPIWVAEHYELVRVANVMSLTVMIGVICCCQKVMVTFPQNYIFLLIITVCMGVMVGSICAFYSTQSVVSAALMTAVIFFVLTTYACFTKTDFTGMGPYIMCFLLGMLFVAFMGIFFCCSKTYDMIYSALGAMLFSFYIVFDTQLICGGGHKRQFSIDDYVLAALNIYLDIINLFIFLLEIFGKR